MRPPESGAWKILEVMASPSDPAILAPKSVGPEIGNSRFREWGSTLQAEGQGPASDASLFGGPFPPQGLRYPGRWGHSHGRAGA